MIMMYMEKTINYWINFYKKNKWIKKFLGLSIVIPIYNEVGNIEKLIDKINLFSKILYMITNSY